MCGDGISARLLTTNTANVFSAMRRTVLLYGLLGGILIVTLKLVEYRFLVIEHSLEIYGGLVAALFAALGIWLGLKLTKPREVVKEVLVVRDAQPFMPDPARLEALGITPREHEILTLIAAGLSNREIAEKLFVSENTVKTHSARIFMKLNAKRRTQAVQIAKEAGLIALVAYVAASTGCANKPTGDPGNPAAGIDSLNARLVSAYRNRDPQAYAALYTDTAVFEWPAFTTVRGPAALAEMARNNFAGERDVDLRLDVASRRVASDAATEFGAFQQTWTDSAGVRRVEYGRYVTQFARQHDGQWKMDRFFGFEDSTRAVSRQR